MAPLATTTTYWAPSSGCGEGAQDYLWPQFIFGRWWEDGRVEVEQSLAEGGWLFKGLTSEADPTQVYGARQIAHFHETTDLRNLGVKRVATLKRESLHVRGMHGFGDNIHQRALMRKWLEAGHDVYLESSHAAIYWDLVENHGLKVIHKPSALRTQMKNATRERELGRFYTGAVPLGAVDKTIWWRANDVRRLGSVFQAMCHATGVESEGADFRLPVKPEWTRAALERVTSWRPTKPIMVVRPLIERTEWSGCAVRNPDHGAYGELYSRIRDRFFVVSLADVEEDREWIVGTDMRADVSLHRGELAFEEIVGLVSMAACVYSSPGFMMPLAQAVGTPAICVFGGYEDGRSFSFGAKFTPTLNIEPIKPCPCFLHHHDCNKVVDVAKQSQRLVEFIDQHVLAGKRQQNEHSEVKGGDSDTICESGSGSQAPSSTNTSSSSSPSGTPPPDHSAAAA